MWWLGAAGGGGGKRERASGEGGGIRGNERKGIAAVLVLSYVKVLISMEAQSHTHSHIDHSSRKLTQAHTCTQSELVAWCVGAPQTCCCAGSWGGGGEGGSTIFSPSPASNVYRTTNLTIYCSTTKAD